MSSLLSDDARLQLSSEINKALLDAVSKVSNNKELERPFLKSVTELCKWLNISRPTAKKLLDSGLPFHEIEGQVFYNKREITEFILSV